MKGISVLSFGFTRGIWEGERGEDFRRMMGYAEHLDDYVIVTNSYKHHRLERYQLAPHVEAIPTNAFCPADSILRMFSIGRAVLRKRRFTLLQAQDPFFSGLVAVLLGKLFKLPVNVCIYGPNVFDKNWIQSHWSHRFLGQLGRWVLHRSRSIQVDGKMTERSFLAAGFTPDRVALKPVVPTNFDRFLNIVRQPRDPSKPVQLLFVGRFCGQKNVPVLIEALRLLKERTKQPFELRLVGEGPDKAALQQLITDAGLGEIAKFTGTATRDEISGVFAGADIFVLSSDYEGYARVLMEAAASALPIVTTAVSGADEAVADGQTGYIVPVGSASAFSEKLGKIVEDHDLRARMGTAARDHIRPQLDPSRNTPGQLAIWKRMANDSTKARPKHLLLFNLATDTKHPILGFTTQWIRELAARCESVHVITMLAGVIDVPANVHVYSVGREHGYSEAKRFVEFYRHLFHILRTVPIDGCFAHMITIFSILAAPVLRPRRIPIVTWYAHPSVTPTLKLAHLASNRMVTSLPSAYPYKHDKLTIIGQGIDTKIFAPVPGVVSEPRSVLCVGRISPVKDHGTLLRAVAKLDCRVTIIGATAGAKDEAFLASLHALAAELGITQRVNFVPSVPPTELPAHYSRCDVHVNLTPAGFGDKVAWEAMSCARPCLVANTEFRETLGDYPDDLLFKHGDPDDLAAKLSALLARSDEDRAKIGQHLRSQVERLHSLPALAESILNEVAASRS